MTKASWNGEHFQRWSCTRWSWTLGSKPPRLQRSSPSRVSEPEITVKITVIAFAKTL